MIDEPGGVAGPPWRRLSSRVLFESRWLRVVRDETVRPDGSDGEYDRVEVPGSVTVLAVDERRRLAITRQWIYVHGGTQWRLPSGRIDDTDRDPESAARRELREETGISADRLVPLGTINCADSFTNHREHTFLATGLRPGAARLEAGEADLEVHWLAAAEVMDLVTSGAMPHAGSSFAVLSAHLRGFLGEEK
ncbi:MAG TPA: NUDIX hydrolase [Actinophytocola sp.]|uniref:NUDIX hydrolase n=1 Tax=Actinophytocola sp. TaxID=1872138 RepID=UPI002DB9C228|nr:NUDIX hydrolase [Actinophytocola sp.]HEU5475610.1 NUDIX hydrolase [Actinophytocola sp.]